MSKILVVDDEVKACELLKRFLKTKEYDVITSNSGEDAIEKVKNEKPDVILLDVRMPGMDGIEVLKQLRELAPLLPVILVTAYGKIDNAVQAVKLGAYDYLTKPLDNEKIMVTLRNALTELYLKREVRMLRSNLKESAPLFKLMGSSDEIKRVYDQVNSVSPTNFTVILYGETGSGKELVAKAVHNQSLRKNGEFVAIDCGAIPETLIESEFFGYERGAFTGADKRKEGYFETASKGTLFLDEIGNLPRHMQSKLLRSLEERRIRRLGGKKDKLIDVRIIVASNEKLGNLVNAGKFREDLYHRLNEFTIEIPPLRKRKNDIVYLSKRFLDEVKLELNKNVTGFSTSAIECLFDYDWPGNVRELRNVIRKAVLTSSNNEMIEDQYLPIEKSSLKTDSGDFQTTQPLKVEIDGYEGFSLKDIAKKGLSKIEKNVIMDVLKRTGGNKSKAAKILKIDNTTMHYKIKEYGIRYTP
ncbi:MAG: response regulator [Candidatus Scalindua rubra]|uniref:Response regulator n=1 Tax=Candidatus Scalindua rubra TaxID=1872076 RepID=A0A1E3X5S4_9BACT|nr:MAG: response regulator [Candidatus Scalindua rubra]